MSSFLDKFRRVTSQGNFIPQVDGLRFLAILLVVVFHANGFLQARSSFNSPGSLDIRIGHILKSWDKGVELFFVISGFILALPFANEILLKGRKVSLKFFYLRRVTRLEPPYMVTLVVLFVALLLTKSYTFTALFPSLLASLTYTHMILLGMPLIAVVTWSLEIEIQFYIIAPLIGKIFMLNKLSRRLLLASLILIFPVAQYLAPARILTLYNFIQYFLMGFLLADLYVSKDVQVFSTKNASAVLPGILVLLLILVTDNHSKPYGELVFITAVFLFYYLVLFNPFWQRAFGIPLLTTIGGMCYSIYLWHFAIISAFGNFILALKGPGSYIPNLLFFATVISIPVLLISGVFFLYVEKPCMSSNWHKTLLSKLGIRHLKPLSKLG